MRRRERSHTEVELIAERADTWTRELGAYEAKELQSRQQRSSQVDQERQTQFIDVAAAAPRTCILRELISAW